MRFEPRSGRLALTTTEGVTLLEPDHQTVRRQIPQPQGVASVVGRFYRAATDEAGKVAIAIRYGAYKYVCPLPDSLSNVSNGSILDPVQRKTKFYFV
jgi:hypothetical protein